MDNIDGPKVRRLVVKKSLRKIRPTREEAHLVESASENEDGVDESTLEVRSPIFVYARPCCQ